MSTTTRPTSIQRLSTLILCAASCWQSVSADSLDAAYHLLQVANTQHHYETRTTQQATAIIRSYSSIVSMAVNIDLPDTIKQTISNCYMEVYAWDNFENGLAQILADNLTDKELQLLAGFYGNLGLPPHEIQLFKDTIAKSNLIQDISLEYMWSNSASCVEHDAALILDYVISKTELDNSDLASRLGR